MYKGKRIFVSGGAGVIGQALIEKLEAAGAVLFVGDLKLKPKVWNSTVRYRQGDLNSITREELTDFSPEYFFHLAATFERSLETYDFWHENDQHNVRLSHHLMTCLKDSPSLKKVIFASSYLIYDPKLYNFTHAADQAYCLKETDPINPRNLCGAAKLLHEIELRFFEHFRPSFQTVCARIFRVYGKDSRDVISRWIRSLIKNEEITVYNEEGMFDYIYAEQVAEGLLRLAVSDATGIVNLGNGQARRVSDVINILKSHFPFMQIKRGEDLDIPYEASQANLERLIHLTGWSPQKQIEEVIPHIIAFEKDKLVQSIEESQQFPLNTLVTSVSQKVPLIKALRKAYEKIGNQGRIIGADLNLEVIGKYFTDDFWNMPRLSSLSIEEFIRYCNQHQITNVIPTRDGELFYFAKNRQLLKENGISVMISNSDAVDICLDKLLFFQHLQELGYPVIPTSQKIEDLNTDKYVVKERFGAGSQNIGIHLNKVQALEYSIKLQNPIFQPYIQGEEYSVDLYLDNFHKTKGAIARTRNLVIHGESQITRSVQDDILIQLCSKLAESLSLSGHVVLQLFKDDQAKFHIIECNTRFGGASSLSIALGLDSLYWFLLESQGVSLNDDYPFVRSEQEKTQIRFAKDLII
jgi:carbamoyl-phosphate synthase large subunit